MTAPVRVRSHVIAALAAVAIVIAVVEWLVPTLIRSAHAGESVGFVNDLIGGRDRYPVERYLVDWRAAARPAAGVLTMLLLIAAASRTMSGDRNPLRRLIGGEIELSGGEVLLISAWCGMLAGLLEAGFFTARHFAKDLIADHYYPEVLWMAPLSATIAFAAAAAVLAIFAASAGVRWGPRALSVPLFLAVGWSLLQSGGIGLHPIARVLLATGLAVGLGRIVGARATGFVRLVRRSAIALLPALLTVSAIGIARLGARETALAPGPRDATNVLLIILDTVRAANTSLHGYERATTPEIVEWAAEGVTFEHAHSTAPWTLPSHASMFTGRYHSSLQTGPRAPLGPEPATLAELLGAAGYRTGGFTANDSYTTRASGLDRGFQTYLDLELDAARFAASSWSSRWLARLTRSLIGFPDEVSEKTAETVRRQFVTWLDEGADRPFFAFLNFFDAHEPYVSPPEFVNRFGPGTPGALESRPHDPEELQGALDAYDGAIAYIDREIGRIRDALESRRLLENTLVIITADHGEHWGEHGLIKHSGSVYMPTVHVPLLISLPGRLPRGTRVAAEVSLRDLPATVLDLVGLGRVEEIPGSSLAGVVLDPAAPRSPSLSEEEAWSWLDEWRPSTRGGMTSLVEWPYHYVRFGDGDEALFHAENDPGEEVDLLDSVQDRSARMRAGVDSLLRRIDGGR